QVLGSGPISQHPHEEGIEGAPVPAQQALEGSRIALLELGQQLLVCLLLVHQRATRETDLTADPAAGQPGRLGAGWGSLAGDAVVVAGRAEAGGRAGKLQ